jgi:large subunit ribosomal protein L19
MHLTQDVDSRHGKKKLPSVHVGDSVRVHYLIREGDKERIQIFSGTIISIKGRGISRNITVRRIVQGEGVERIFPLHNPRVKDVQVSRHGQIRRAKLYYLRDRTGKSTRLRELFGAKARSEEEVETEPQDDQGVAVQADEQPETVGV